VDDYCPIDCRSCCRCLRISSSFARSIVTLPDAVAPAVPVADVWLDVLLEPVADDDVLPGEVEDEEDAPLAPSASFTIRSIAAMCVSAWPDMLPDVGLCDVADCEVPAVPLVVPVDPAVVPELVEPAVVPEDVEPPVEPVIPDVDPLDMPAEAEPPAEA
jgi:hypothetical protein